jgi:GDPmannose 4,6-dehydratase
VAHAQQPEPGDFVIAKARRTPIASSSTWRPGLPASTTGGPRAARRALHAPGRGRILTGDASKAREKLDWQPRVSFEDLVHMMYENDLKEEQARAAAAQR